MKETLHIYTRVSSDNQEDNTSLQNQRSKGEQLSEVLKMKPKLWNEGVGSSSKDDLSNRPVLSELMDKVGNGEVKHLYVEFNDRLSRNQKTWAAIRFSLKKNQVLLYNDRDPDPIDLSDPMDDLLLGIMSEISIFDNQVRTQRLHTGKMNRVKEGKWLGGPPPFGYQVENKELIPHPEERKWVNEIFNTYIETKSIDKVRQMLMNNGVQTRRGNPIWSSGSINKLLKNTHYSGYYIVKNGRTNEVTTVECEAIISYEQRKKVDGLLESRSNQKRNVQPNFKHESVLRELLFCGVCGCGYGVKIFKDRPDKDYYYCRSKEANWRNLREGKELYDCNVKGSLKLSKSDDLVLETVVRTLWNSPLFQSDVKSESLRQGFIDNYDEQKDKLDSDNKRLEREVKKISTAIGHLEGLLAVDEDDDLQVRGKIKSLMEKRLDVRNRIDDNNKISKNIKNNKTYRLWIENLNDHLKEMDVLIKDPTMVKERNEFLKQFVERVDVVPSFEEGLSHELSIKLKLPYFNSKRMWLNPFTQEHGYEATDGTHEMKIDVWKENPLLPK